MSIIGLTHVPRHVLKICPQRTHHRVQVEDLGFENESHLHISEGGIARKGAGTRAGGQIRWRRRCYALLLVERSTALHDLDRLFRRAAKSTALLLD